MSKNSVNIYTVHAYRWGDRELHSYSVGVYAKKHKALQEAEREVEWRGGKYECEVIEWVMGSCDQDGGRAGMQYKTIKRLPKMNTLKARSGGGNT